MKNKAIWISFDFGLKGDYKGLYTFLDNHKALDCGQGLAFINYQLQNGEENHLLTKITSDINESVKLSKTDRIYIIWRDASLKIRGEFINGARKQPPWEGYGKLSNDTVPDIGE